MISVKAHLGNHGETFITGLPLSTTITLAQCGDRVSKMADSTASIRIPRIGFVPYGLFKIYLLIKPNN